MTSTVKIHSVEKTMTPIKSYYTNFLISTRVELKSNLRFFSLRILWGDSYEEIPLEWKSCSSKMPIICMWYFKYFLFLNTAFLVAITRLEARCYLVTDLLCHAFRISHSEWLWPLIIYLWIFQILPLYYTIGSINCSRRID